MAHNTMIDKLSYHAKRVVVTGAASGIGEATARVLEELGAEVIPMDSQEVDLGPRFIRFDLLDQKSIDAAADQMSGPIHGLFNCAGVGSSVPGWMAFAINFVGTRYLIDRIVPLMPAGSGIVSIATTGSYDWRDHISLLKPLLETPDFASARAWVDENSSKFDYCYPASKRALQAYTVLKARQLLSRGIHINTVAPHATVTPGFRKFFDHAPPEYHSMAYAPGGRSAEPEVQAYAMAFLNSSAADYITGINLPVDGGFLTEFHPVPGDINFPELADDD